MPAPLNSLFFLVSALVEVALARHHRKAKRFGPGPGNNYTSGYARRGGVGGFLSRFRRNKKGSDEPDSDLPAHTTPAQLDGRQSYATDATAVGHHDHSPYASGDYSKHETGYGYANGGLSQSQPPQNYRYDDGTYTRV